MWSLTAVLHSWELSSVQFWTEFYWGFPRLNFAPNLSLKGVARWNQHSLLRLACSCCLRSVVDHIMSVIGTKFEEHVFHDILKNISIIFVGIFTGGSYGFARNPSAKKIGSSRVFSKASCGSQRLATELAAWCSEKPSFRPTGPVVFFIRRLLDIGVFSVCWKGLISWHKMLLSFCYGWECFLLLAFAKKTPHLFRLGPQMVSFQLPALAGLGQHREDVVAGIQEFLRWWIQRSAQKMKAWAKTGEAGNPKSLIRETAWPLATFPPNVEAARFDPQLERGKTHSGPTPSFWFFDVFLCWTLAHCSSALNHVASCLQELGAFEVCGKFQGRGVLPKKWDPNQAVEVLNMWKARKPQDAQSYTGNVSPQCLKEESLRAWVISEPKISSLLQEEQKGLLMQTIPWEHLLLKDELKAMDSQHFFSVRRSQSVNSSFVRRFAGWVRRLGLTNCEAQADELDHRDFWWWEAAWRGRCFWKVEILDFAYFFRRGIF